MPDWQIMAYAIVLPIGYEDPVDIPTGWEPIGTLARQGNNAVVLCRRPAAPAGGTPPYIESITPNSLPSGGVPLTVTVVGSGFDDTCTVTVDDLARATFYVSPTQLQYTARPDLMAAGQYSVKVVRGDETVSNTVTFTYT